MHAHDGGQGAGIELVWQFSGAGMSKEQGRMRYVQRLKVDRELSTLVSKLGNTA